MADRVILHCDCNAFFASVETVRNPALANIPMAVCGDPAKRHGIILAKNELAKQAGVKTAETIGQAKKMCPSLTLVLPHYDAYADYSARIHAILERYTDLVEPFGLDEAWLDVTGSRRLFGDGRQIADSIRAAVRAETGLTVSVGVSFNKVFAKLGSDYKKPDATTVLDRASYRQIVHPLPVADLLYAGTASVAVLHSMHIHTIGDLAAANRAFLELRLGKLGGMLHDYACGLDESPVLPATEERDLKSLGRGMTFRRDLMDEEEAFLGLLVLSEEVASRLRRHRRRALGVQLTVKDPNLRVITRSMTLPAPTDLAHDLLAAAKQLYRQAWKSGKSVRMLTVTATHLTDLSAQGEQLSFFEDPAADQTEKYEKIETAMDGIRERYGKTAIGAGAVLHNDIGIDTAHPVAPAEPSDVLPRTDTYKEEIK